jgi:hypothetical protein
LAHLERNLSARKIQHEAMLSADLAVGAARLAAQG